MLAALWHAAATWGMQYAMLSLALGGGERRVCRIYGTYCSTRTGVDISVVVRGRRVIATGRTDAVVFCQRPPEPDRQTGEHIIAVRRTLNTQRTHTHTVPDQPCGRCGKCHGTQASGGPPEVEK